MSTGIDTLVSRHPSSETDIEILCVDDDESVREQLAAHLDSDRVRSVPSAQEALARLAAPEQSVDCLVSAFHLPETDGLSFLEAVRAEDSTIPFILFTAQGSEALASEAVSAGVTDYVRKGEPGAFDRLATSITEAVAQARTSRLHEAAHAHFRALTEEAPFAVVTVDETSTIRYANDTVSAIFGYDPAELVGEPLVTLIPERLRDRHTVAFDRYLDTGARTLDWEWVEFPGVHRDGHELPLGITFGEAPNDGGQLFTAVVRDISGHVDRREELDRRAAAMEAAMDGMAILDADEEYVYVNQAHADIYGFDSPDALVGETWHCLYDDEEVRRFEDEIFPAISEVGQWRGEAVGTRTDGTTFPQEVSLSALDDGGLVCVVRDITERKRREQAVQALHEATRQMMRSTDRQRVADRAVEAARDLLDMPVNGLWFHDPDPDHLRPVAWTTEATEVVGDLPTYPAEEESLSWDVFERGDAEVFADLFEHHERYNPATPIRSEIIVPLGEHGVMNVGATDPNVFDETDVVLARLLAANTRAALDQIETTQALRNRTEQLERQNRYLSQYYALTTDPETAFDTKLKNVLGLGCEHFGFDVGLLARLASSTVTIVETHAPGLRIVPGDTLELPSDTDKLDLVPPPEAADDGVERATAAPGDDAEDDADVSTLQKLFGFEAYLQVPVYVGEERYGLLVFGSPTAHTEPLESSAVTLARFVARWLDYELARQRIRRELERQNDRLEEFTSVVSHELRTPLNTAIGYLDLAREECESDHLGGVSRALDRMEALIEDTLTLARHGRTVEEPEAVSLVTVVERAWETVAPDGDLRVEFDDVTLVADPDRLQQVFENLFRNAAEHAGPDVTVRVGQFATRSGVFVADDGPGISADDRDSVFDHGYSTSEDGTGFGLSIVRSIVEAHGWSIDVTESEDGGARFDISGVEPG